MFLVHVITVWWFLMEKCQKCYIDGSLRGFNGLFQQTKIPTPLCFSRRWGPSPLLVQSQFANSKAPRKTSVMVRWCSVALKMVLPLCSCVRPSFTFSRFSDLWTQTQVDFRQVCKWICHGKLMAFMSKTKLQLPEIMHSYCPFSLTSVSLSRRGTGPWPGPAQVHKGAYLARTAED